jgi:hypothetical protein
MCCASPLFATTQVTALNKTVDYCAPTAISCTYSQAWPKAALTSTVSGGTQLDTLQDVLGNTTNATLRR